MKVWALADHDDDGDAVVPAFPEDLRLFATEALAQAEAEVLNEKALARWVSQPAEDSWRFKQRLDAWKAANFDVPEDKRTPRPEQRMRQPEDFPDDHKTTVVAIDVKEA